MNTTRKLPASLHKSIAVRKTKNNKNVSFYRIQGQVMAYDLNDQDSFLKLLGFLDQAYHNQVKPHVTDDEYDRLVDLYEMTFNKSYEKVGAPVLIEKVKQDTIRTTQQEQVISLKGNPKVKCQLPYVMSSLNKIKGQKQLNSWLAQSEIQTLIDSNANDVQVMIMNKPDGISALIDYYPPSSSSDIMNRNHHNVRLTTRGNGRVGFDISHLLPHLKLPDPDLVRKHDLIQRIASIRMELVLTKDAFEQIQVRYNHELNDARTTLAGVINATHDLDEFIAQSITCIAYEVMYHNWQVPGLVPTIKDELNDLHTLGFLTPQEEIWSISDINQFDVLAEQVVKRKNLCTTEMDGIVLALVYPQVKLKQIEELGKFRMAKQEKNILQENEVLKHDPIVVNATILDEEDQGENEYDPSNLDDVDVEKPWSKIAIKIQGAKVLSKVTTVTWNVSRHGIMFPTVYVEPVKCGHVTIEKASGKSGEFIRDNVIAEGSILQLGHSGDTIPDILDILQSSTSGKPQLPDLYVIPWHWNANQVHIMVNDLNHPEVGRARLIAFFADLKASHLGEATCSALYNHFNGNWYAILSCSVEELIKLDGFQKKKATSTCNMIRKVITNVPLWKLMKASSMFKMNLGSTRFQTILDAYPDVLNWQVNETNKKQYIDWIQALPKFNTLSDQFVNCLPAFQTWLRELPMIQYRGAKEDPPQLDISTLPERKVALPTNVCFSGFRNNQWEALIKLYGGCINSTIAKSTTLLVVKNKNSGNKKEDLAKDKGIRIMSMNEFAEEYHL